jgi:hypothetical protein
MPKEIGDKVYFTAYLKSDKEKFFLCGGLITAVTPRQSYKVRIDQVATHSVGEKEGLTYPQTILLGQEITKKATELTDSVANFMTPTGWVMIIRMAEHED